MHGPRKDLNSNTAEGDRDDRVVVRGGSREEIRSEFLLRGAREVLIRHGGEIYRLRHTRNDKLILTK
jgi:hemin uptake protein HemP